jgi:adenine-specific DNA-methyltransferase
VKGFVPTPDSIVDLMVEKLFKDKNPQKDDTLLDPGCGTGSFIEGVIRWCNLHSIELPKIVGIESDPRHIPEARRKFQDYSSIEIRNEDFLTDIPGTFDYIIGNPPYVSITKLTEEEKNHYRKSFQTASGRFDLYLLFFEQGLRCLEKEGRLVFITPEKFLYVQTARNLRSLLGGYFLKEIHLLPEETFGDLTTYPTVTTVLNTRSKEPSDLIFRDGSLKRVMLPKDGSSFLPTMNGKSQQKSGHFELRDVSIRVSCGVATGADSVFIKPSNDIDPCLVQFAFPTIAGRQLSVDSPSIQSDDLIIMPYTRDGKIIPEKKLGCLKDYLTNAGNYEKLLKRTCVSRKPWYAFHENPPLDHILRPKILCKDITMQPHFWIDHAGEFVPRHSVYYIVPKNEEDLESLCDYLNSGEARSWLEAHCQRAANGFIRLQSNVLKHLPIPWSILEQSGERSKDHKSGIRTENPFVAIVKG